jgi:hypothetical protein
MGDLTVTGDPSGDGNLAVMGDLTVTVTWR